MDFNYKKTGGLYRIHPVSQQAIELWNKTTWLQAGLFIVEFNFFKIDAKKAGYTLEKLKPPMISDEELMQLCS
jgi:hypothetical protein